jgi:arginine utilization protein RocB
LQPIALDEGQRINNARLLRADTPFRRYLSKHHVTTITVSKYGQNKCIALDVQTKEPNIFVETGETLPSESK